MKLTVLVDNNTYIDQYYCGEPAAAYYLEDGDSRILWDSGYSDIILHNAQGLGVDLGQLTDIAISHGHDDHTRGPVSYTHLDVYKRQAEIWCTMNAPKQFIGHKGAVSCA